MSLVKRTYALPQETLGQFESNVPSGQRSALLATLIQEWLDCRRKEELRRQIIEGCAEMADLYLEIEKEYHPLEESLSSRG